MQNMLNEIQKEMQTQLNRPWLPFFCQNNQEKSEFFHSIDIPHATHQSGIAGQQCQVTQWLHGQLILSSIYVYMQEMLHLHNFLWLLQPLLFHPS